jgi:hypothetical protein
MPLVSLKTKMKTQSPVPAKAIVLLLGAVVVLAVAPRSPAADSETSSVSPDKKWEYTCEKYGSDQCAPEIVNIATQDIVVDLSDLPSGRNAPDARVVWAPDSQRFGFNHSPPHASHTSYETTALYQLRDNKWVPLDSPVDPASERSQLWQLTKKSPKSGGHRDLPSSSPRSDILRVRKWTDANTAILYASADGAAALFTLKFDAKGKWKIVAMHRMSKAEMEKEDAAE